MAAVIDLAKFALTKEELTSVKDLVYRVSYNLLNQLYSVLSTKELNSTRMLDLLKPGGLVGKAGQGCNPTAQSWNIITRKITWAPADWEVFLKHCYKRP